ncbi:hypothetical protein WJX73_008676 [Symbiochloris irregularis]|uniref:Histidine--tRNA ligase, cytoplasmic n=1 Tax=Symbiochloris irregularis TaxID=706552 RepID=A0AAW1Q0L3_9CHLO
MVQDHDPGDFSLAASFVDSSRALAHASVAVGALTVEALQASVKPLADKTSQEGQASSSVTQCVALLMGLVHGSKRANHRKGAGELNEVLQIPQRTGSWLQQLEAASKSLPSESAPEQEPSSAACWQPPYATLASAACCGIGVAHLSLQRSRRLGAQLDGICTEGGDEASAQELLSRGQATALELSRAAAEASLGTTGDAQSLSQALRSAGDAVGAAVHACLSLEANRAFQVLTDAQAGKVPGSVSAPGAQPPADGQANGTPAPARPAKIAPLKLGKGTDRVLKQLQAAVQSLPSLPGSRAGHDSRLALQAAKEVLSPSNPILGHLNQELQQLAEDALGSGDQIKAKAPKGTRDIEPADMAVREVVFARIKRVFERHGAKAIDTPVFELRKTLTGKYGEDSKLIYDLADQGGEALSLRYDLTVPFARFCGTHNVASIKRYHIAKVYRRDQPQLAKGRYREFTQCDFDLAGKYVPMGAEAEVLQVLWEIMRDLGMAAWTVKLNHRRLLDAMMRVCGVPPDKFRATCSAIDKLDKEPWAAVEAEMVDTKGLPREVAQRIKGYVEKAGELGPLIQQLKEDCPELAGDAEASSALGDLSTLARLLQHTQVLPNVRFDLSLARGLDYYTGLIYEVVLEGAQVGSVAAGGRYDGLVGMFSGKDIAAVGISIGIERLFTVMAERMGSSIRPVQTQVLVASAGKGLFDLRWQLANQLWAADIATEFGLARADPSPVEQFGYAGNNGIPFVVMFGADELQKGVCKVKDMASGEEVESVPETLVSVDWSRGQLSLAPSAVQGREELQALCLDFADQLAQLKEDASASSQRLAAALALRERMQASHTEGQPVGKQPERTSRELMQLQRLLQEQASLQASLQQLQQQLVESIR